METIRPLVQEAQLARGLFAEDMAAPQPTAPQPTPGTGANPVSGSDLSDPERVHAAVALALQAALPMLVREIAEKVLVALGH